MSIDHLLFSLLLPVHWSNASCMYGTGCTWPLLATKLDPTLLHKGLGPTDHCSSNTDLSTVEIILGLLERFCHYLTAELASWWTGKWKPFAGKRDCRVDIAIWLTLVKGLAARGQGTTSWTSFVGSYFILLQITMIHKHGPSAEPGHKIPLIVPLCSLPASVLNLICHPILGSMEFYFIGQPLVQVPIKKTCCYL